ncbi:MAG: response regulator transcription factor, partial [Clostridiales bacterium]|nr:response regulator transcription factor [Clostridiales bacterium]
MNPSILIVEDDAHIAQLIQMTLQVSGYRTEICPDGIAARARLSDQAYDLIILDVMLPGLDGFSLMEALQQAGKSL